MASDYLASRKGISGITQPSFILSPLALIQRSAWTGWICVKACWQGGTMGIWGVPLSEGKPVGPAPDDEVWVWSRVGIQKPGQDPRHASHCHLQPVCASLPNRSTHDPVLPSEKPSILCQERDSSILLSCVIERAGWGIFSKTTIVELDHDIMMTSNGKVWCFCERNTS